MIVVGLDCSGDDIVLGVAEEDRILGSWQVPARRRHAEFLPGELLARLEEVRLQPADVNGFSIIAGPGSFTGLRVGAATVMGLAAQRDIPVTTLTSFEFHSRLYRIDGRALGCLIPCRGELYYWSLFPVGDPAGAGTRDCRSASDATHRGAEKADNVLSGFSLAPGESGTRPTPAGTPPIVIGLAEIVRLVPPLARVVGPRVEKLREAVHKLSPDIEIIEGLPPNAGGRLAIWGKERIKAGQVVVWGNWHPEYGPAPGFRTWSMPRH